MAAFDGAIAQLTQQVKVYEKTGARGLLGDIARQIAEKEGLRAQLDREISAQDAARERLVQINLLLNHLNQELAENSRKLEAVSGEEKKLEAANHLIREIDERIEAFCQKLNALETELGGMIPGHEQLEQIKQQEQLRATLQQRLNVLQLEKENVTSNLSTLISRYGETLPTAEQLDEAQRLYGEMQGLLSASKSDAESDPVPEAYTLITNAANVMEDFAGKLQSAIQTSARIHELILQLDAQKKDLQHEINAWNSKTKRFSELDADVKKLQCKLKEQQNDAPVVIQPTIAALEEIAKKQRELGQREAEAKAQIAHEEKEWSKRKAEYAELKKQLATLEEHLEAQRCYGDTPVQETLSRLSEHQHAQQKLKALHASLDSLCLSEAEEALLKSSPDTLPDPDEGNEMLKKQRQVQRYQDELQGLSSRLEGEKAKKDSLVASLEQWNAATRTAPAPVSEPKKPASKALVCSGVAFLIAGGFLSLMILPILAGISVFGALLIAAGLINSRSYQKKAQAYANHQKAAAEYEAAKEQQQRINRKLTEVQNSIEHVKAQMEDVEHKISSEKAALSAWLAQWGNANAENMEAEILRIVEWSAHIAQLRSRQADNLAVQRSMQELQENLKAERVVIEKAYPITAGMTAAEASETLQAAYTRYRILAEQVQNARQLLNRFIADGTIPENEYTKADAPRASILLQQLQDVKAEKEQLCALRLKIDRQYPDISGRFADDAIAFLRDRMSLYQVAESQVNSSVQNLERFFNETGYCRNELSLNESPHLAVVMAACASTEQELNRLLQNANMVLKELELDTDAAHICQALSKADELLNIYIQHNAKCADLEVRKEKNRRQANEVQQALVRQLTFPGVRLIDSIDFCMRLALVDTLFEKEQPFLILDDPFVNLDEKRLEKALELLNVMAANKQIIYFVCHPIRAIEAGKNKDMSVQEKLSQLAETTRKARDDRSAMQISRSTPVQKAPKEIYRIVESAASQAIKPANPHYTITNSIFSLSFIAGESARQQNYCFELFFIDACGRVLNDRQIIEISGGQLSVDRIQFNLNTRDDSGDEFELMIRESGHNDYEIAAKYSFRAKLAFTGTFNFDM